LKLNLLQPMLTTKINLTCKCSICFLF